MPLFTRLQTPAKDAKQPESNIEMGLALTLLASSMDTMFLASPGLKAQLQGYQNQAGQIADSLQVCVC